MRDTLEPDWEYFREALSEAERSFIISEASRGRERSMDPDLLEEFLFERDPEQDEKEAERNGKDLLYSVALQSSGDGEDSMAGRITHRELPGLDKGLFFHPEGSMKDTYTSFDEEIVVQVPRVVDFGEDPQRIVEQALTWQHNYQTLMNNSVPVATVYDLIISEKNDVILPALIGEFREGLVEFPQLTDEDKEMYGDVHGESDDFLEKNFRRHGVKIADLLLDGEVAYNEAVDDLVNPPFNGIAYHRPSGDILVYDMGEIGVNTFDLLGESDTDSYDEFMERHGIREKAERILQNYDN